MKIDADTEGVIGHVPVTETILKKIAACDAFVPDLTFVAQTPGGKLVPNPNVMLEYGYALRARSYSVMIPVMNTAYGPPEKLPFDMGHSRHPLQFELPITAANAERRSKRASLSQDFERILRQMMGASDGDVEISNKVSEQVEKFRANRIAQIGMGTTPVPLMDEGILAVHLVPFGSFDKKNSFQFSTVAANSNAFAPLWSAFPQRHQITHDGLTTTSNSEAPRKPQRAYTTVFRSGALEAVASTLGGPKGWIILPELQARIIKHSFDYMRGLKACGADAPFLISVEFLKVSGFRIIHDFIPGGAFREDLPSGRIGQDQLKFAATVVPSMPRNMNECARQLRDTLNHIANTSGLATAPYFDDAGNSTLRL